MYIDRGESDTNKEIFDQLFQKKDEIEKVFGAPLNWERLDGKKACRIKTDINTGGYRSPESSWPALQEEMVDAMTRLEKALIPHIESLKL